MAVWRYGRVGDIVTDMTILVRLAYLALMLSAAAGPALVVGMFTRSMWALMPAGIAGGLVVMVFLTNDRLNAWTGAGGPRRSRSPQL